MSRTSFLLPGKRAKAPKPQFVITCENRYILRPKSSMYETKEYGRGQPAELQDVNECFSSVSL
jgi:hypothetical protein